MEKELKFPIHKKIFQFYKGIARFHVNNLFFNFYIEKHIFKLVKNVVLIDKY